MPKKNWTAEERAAFGAKMKAARKKVPTDIIDEKTDGVSEEAYQALLQHVKELAGRVEELTSDKIPAPQVSAKGMVGTIEKYVSSPTAYPDPRERLAHEQRLAGIAFPLNYDLKFEISPTRYQTIDGIWMREPKFNLDLIGIVFDEEGTPTNKRYIMRRLVFFEDPDAAMIVARDNGIPVDESNQKAFLDEMRYLRMRDWLFEVFWPPKPQTALNKREEVIGNQLVEVFEVSSETPQTIPFEQLNKKL